MSAGRALPFALGSSIFGQKLDLLLAPATVTGCIRHYQPSAWSDCASAGC